MGARTVRVFQILIFLAIGTADPVDGQSPRAAEELEKLFGSYMGVWLPDPDWLAQQEERSVMETLIPLAFTWGLRRASIEYRAGLPINGELFTTGLINWNPVSEQVEFMAVQAWDTEPLIYRGYYHAIDSMTLQRVYDVTYPDASVIKWRETFFRVSQDQIDWMTERFDGESWIPNNPSGPESGAVRATNQPSDSLSALARIIGDWLPDTSRSRPDTSRTSAGTNGHEGSVRFAWGTDERWIEVVTRAPHDGGEQVERSGLIAWDPHYRSLRYRGYTKTGRSLDGVIVFVNGQTIRRYYRSFQPDGSMQQWVDTWRWADNDDSCFEWTTSEVIGDHEANETSTWVCRSRS